MMSRSRVASHSGRTSFDIGHKLSLRGELCAECSEKRVWTLRDAEGG